MTGPWRSSLTGLFAVLLMFQAGLTLSLSEPLAAAAAQAGATVSGSVVDASLTPLAGVVVTLESNGKVVARATTDAQGKFRLAGVAAGEYTVRATKTGLPAFWRTVRIAAGASAVQLPIVLAERMDAVNEVVLGGARQGTISGLPQSTITAQPTPTVPPPAKGIAGGAGGGRGAGGAAGFSSAADSFYSRTALNAVEFLPGVTYPGNRWPEPGETYAPIDPNRFRSTRDHPLSTFGADVDTASYSNVRRFLSQGQLPPRDAVRVEEFVNYFRFNYPAPRDGRPIALTTEIGDCPWAPGHKLVLVGARAVEPRVLRPGAPEIEGRNIVLLIDVSGSMAPPERLPMIKTALGMFVDTLRPDDTLSIVTYAGTSGVALFPTPARRRDVIQGAISRLNANGSTNGGQGLMMAYRIAREAFVPGGVNRVILATDGDFNVGITSQYDLLQLIERERESGVFLSVFGVGSGNLKDATMEMLADKGNGHYAYLDSLQEARRMLVREADSTLETVAKDVKFQVEFNPAVVSAWKLIGYENRQLAARDFNNDRKDGGEMGAGHSVTVLYEVIPAGAERNGDEVEPVRAEVDPLKYQGRSEPVVRPDVVRPATSFAGEWLTVKARYKLPEGDRSDLLTVPVRADRRVQHLPFASAIAEFGLLLRDAPRNSERWASLERRVSRLSAPAAQAADMDGFRELVAIAAGLARLGSREGR